MSILSQQKQSQAPDFPNIRPSLDLRFALAKKLDPRITFTRGSTGTYFGPDGIMRTAGVNEPRFDHDPITGQSLGLLIEEARTNNAKRSEDLTIATGYWSEPVGSDGVTVTTNQTIAPDGNQTADKVSIKTAGALTKSIQSSIINPSTIGQSYTASIFCKAAERFYVRVDLEGGGASRGIVVNLLNGSLITQVNSPVNYSIQPYPNGWYRISATSTATTTNANALRVYLTNASGTTSFVGTPGDGVYLWGGQLEAGAFPTSYIPTGDATVTRNPDNVDMTGTNFSSWYNQTEGTFFTQAKSAATISAITRRFLEVTNASASQRYLLGYSTTSNTRFLVTTSVNNNVANILLTASPSSGVKMSASYSTNNFAQATNGVLGTRDLDGTVPTVNRMIIGWDTGSTNANLCGTISRLTYYPIAITQNQLINLTS